ncbi:hypothetical protein GCM10011316_11550 [Roseibium aquae]|uniref:Cellulose biosynthesis protein BcsN n=1 Tax=Roseibium aquae TaxID=1323746 RepID=A0A916TE24_9HYPH|nr:hypothetical protein GCM10011316_11550 [Roseibium aquae]
MHAICYPFAAILALALAGCANTPKVAPLSNSTLPPKEQAFVTPPPGGPAVLGIVQKDYSNGVQQDITLANRSKTPGQNLLRVQVIGGHPEAPEKAGRLSDAFPDEQEISREIKQFLPGMRLTRASVLLQNSYGPFSYAAGRSASGDICLYAWQHLSQQLSRKTIFSPRGTIQIRLRLCDPKKSELDLLRTMYGLSINVAVLESSWDPYLRPSSPPDAWGRAGHPILPQSMEGFVGVVPARQVPARSAPRLAPPPVPVAQPVQAVNPSGAVRGDEPKPAISVIVPPPPSSAITLPSPPATSNLNENTVSTGG